MYSKSGKQSVNRFLILNHKEEILSYQPRKHVAKRRQSDCHTHALHSLASLRKLAQEATRDIAHPFESAKNTLTSSFTAQSREQLYLSVNTRAQTPSFGHYSCNYNLVRKTLQVTDIAKRPQTQSRRRRRRTRESILTPEKPRKHVPAPVPFTQQLPRSVAERDNEVPRACSFDTAVPFDKNCSTIDFSRSLARDSGYLKTHFFSTPHYDPKYELVCERVKTPNFSVGLQKKSLGVGQGPQAVYQPNYALTQKKTYTPVLLGRPARKSPFPSHMHQPSSRLALDTITVKTLAMNYKYNSNVRDYIRLSSQRRSS